MNSRYLLIASAAFAVATAASAEPVKPAAAPVAEAANGPTKVLMASAERIQTPAPLAAAAAAPQSAEAAPVKRPRAARVTSCRCAGQNEQ
jgi:hypothetical protein